MDIAHLLETYPRQRPPLTPGHARIYAEQYRLNREGARPIENLAQRLERWMHHQVSWVQGGPILELGAGTLNHRQYEGESVEYDVVEPFRDLYLGRPEAKNVRAFYDRVEDIPPYTRYQRVVSVAVLEHMEDLPRDIAAAALRLEGDGVFQAGIPSEGGLLWWVGWRFSTGISYYLRTGLDYGVVMHHEHINAAPEILAIIEYLFHDVHPRRFPFPWHQLSFYTYLEAREPRLDRCRSLTANAD